MGHTIPMNFKKLFLTVCIFSRVYAENSLSFNVGPGWLFFQTILSPATEANSLVAASNDDSAWNLISGLGANLVLDAHKYFNVSFNVFGEFLRNGIVTITDARGFVNEDATFFSLDAITNGYINARTIILDGQFKIPIKKPFSIKFNLGYSDNFEYEQFNFLFSPLIFFQKNRYKALHGELSFSTKYNDAFIKCAYEFFVGTLYMRRTGNDSDTLVFRKVPKFIVNGFKVELGYELFKDFSIIEKIIYESADNHETGTSIIYSNNIKQSVQKNVNAVKSKKLMLISSFEYAF